MGGGLCAEYYGFQKDYPLIDYTSLEITPSYVNFCRAKNIQALEGSVEKMPFAENSFDCVYIRDTMRHLESYQKAINEAFRVCKKEVMIVFAKQLLKGDRDDIQHDSSAGSQIYNNSYS